MPIKQQPTHERGDRKVFHIYFMLSLLIIILNKIINKDKNDNKKKKNSLSPPLFSMWSNMNKAHEHLTFFSSFVACLGDKGRGRGTFVSPVGRELAGAAVVSGKTVDF